jgi:uncharacterized membrane protein HdeD (DUF308 family)
MIWTTMLFGTILITLGLFGYFGVEQTSWTTLIPTALGVPLLVSGVLALKQSFRKSAMHAAVFLALLGLVGTAHAFWQLVLREPGLVVQSVTAILCGVFLWLGIKSFLEARRQRPAPEQPPAEHGPDKPGA